MVFRLDFPQHVHPYPVFHVSLLGPYDSISTIHWVVLPLPTVSLAQGPKYEVEDILDLTIKRNKP